MTKEEVYRQQLKALGIYEEAFEPEITTLCQMERDLGRARKAWSATVPKGEKPSLLDPHFAVITALRRDVLAHREALGLTPKALRRLRGAAPDGPSQQDLIVDRLDLIARRVSSYGAEEPSETSAEAQAYAAEVVGEWQELMSNFNTGEEG